jgi:hypothetical protein
MRSKIIIRVAVMPEQQALEAVQLRASLTNDGDREALLANPDAIRIPLEQLAAGRVFVAELNGETLGFSAIEPRVDGQIDLDALFVEPKIRPAWHWTVDGRILRRGRAQAGVHRAACNR